MSLSWLILIQSRLLIVLIETILRELHSPNVKFLRVMTIADWNKKPFTYEVFRQPFHPMSFNYIDYMDV